MMLNDKKILEIIKIVLTALISIATTLFATSCTVSLSVSKNNSGSPQSVEHSSTVTADSASVVIPVSR